MKKINLLERNKKWWLFQSTEESLWQIGTTWVTLIILSSQDEKEDVQHLWHSPPAPLHGCARVSQPANHVYNKISNPKRSDYTQVQLFLVYMKKGNTWKTMVLNCHF